MEAKATTAGLIAVLMFSIGTLIYALSAPIPTFQFLAMSFIVGGISLTCFQFYQSGKLFSYWRQSLKNYLFMLTAICLYNVLLLLAFKLVPPFETNILHYLWPILMLFFVVVLDRTILGLPIMMGMVFGFLGMIMLFLPSGGAQLFQALKWGHVLSIIAAIMWAVYSVLSRRFDYPSGFIAPIMIISGVICAIMHVMLEDTVVPSAAMWGLIILFGVSRFCYVLWDYAMQYGNRLLVSTAAYFVPLLSTLLFILFGFKPTTPFVAVGSGLIIAGCIVANSDKLVMLIQKGMKK